MVRLYRIFGNFFILGFSLPDAAFFDLRRLFYYRSAEIARPWPRTRRALYRALRAARCFHENTRSKFSVSRAMAPLLLYTLAISARYGLSCLMLRDVAISALKIGTMGYWHMPMREFR